jgi:acyl-CoA thioester hydrolase
LDGAVTVAVRREEGGKGGGKESGVEPDAAQLVWDRPAPFAIRLQPAAADIDGLNHVNNAVYVQWCEQVAWKHSEHLGLGLADYQRLDRAMAIRRGEYDYLLPALLGDDLILATWLTDSDGKLSMVRRFQLVRAGDGQTLLRGRWDLVCIEMSSGKARRMPAEFLQAYGAVIGS